jgi:hypothetical protein
MIDKNALELYELIVALHEGTLTDAQFAALNEKLKDKNNARHYTEFISIFSGLTCPSTADLSLEGAEGEMHEDQNRYTDIMLKFAAEENAAPAVNVPRPQARTELISNVQYAPVPAAANRISLFTIAATAAVFVMMILFAQFAPVMRSKEVATLTASLNAEWAESVITLQDGVRLETGSDSLQLRHGAAEIEFDSGVRVMIESPAEFRISSNKEVKLFYGKIYASVPKQAIGFSVNTLNSKVIDLGTEFGVKAEADGTSQVHVIEGKVNLIAGSASDKVSFELPEGHAKQVFGFSSRVRDIPCEYRTFVRKISPGSGAIWRGEMVIDLADVASGGNGFGTAHPHTGIDLNNGRFVSGNSERRGRSSGGYIPVAESAFVDGVFVPIERNNPVQITSQGHTYSDFGTTNTQIYMPVGTYRTVNMYYAGKNEWENDIALTVTNRENANPVILCLHANAGITFDLNAIRESVPFLNVRQFSSEFGIAQTTGTVLSDFYVFVDGQLRMMEKDVSSVDEPLSVSIPLEPSDRFLTLVCTEGAENYRDWTLFVNPVLEVELREKIQ